MRYGRPICLFVACGSCWLGGLDGQPPPGGQDLITSARPISDVADRLRHTFGKVVTYEDGLWEWPGEMSPSGTNTTGRGALVHTTFSLTAPDETALAPDLPTKLAQILAAYHQQTEGPRFQLLTSSYGIHIVPLQVRDRSGQFAPAQNALDEHVFIPHQERTAHDHMRALVAAVAAAGNGLEMIFGSQVVNVKGLDAFNYLFAPTPADNHPFVWGTTSSNMTARDALIDLLDRSATTFFWELRCRGTGSVKYNLCVLNLGPLEITTVGADGKPAKQQLRYDRCGGCVGGREILPSRRAQK
jgi:hypothetical protein